MVAAIRGGGPSAALPSNQLIHGMAVARAPDRSGANNSDPGRKRTGAAAVRPAAAAPAGKRDRRLKMARKRATVGEFDLFDVFYEDGTQRSNRRVPSAILGGLDGDAPARTVIEEQDRLIAEKSGRPVARVKSIRRSGIKPEPAPRRR